jgi:multidrug efflux pump subunit AcrA (membrane-fusion protein)
VCVAFHLAHAGGGRGHQAARSAAEEAQAQHERLSATVAQLQTQLAAASQQLKDELVSAREAQDKVIAPLSCSILLTSQPTFRRYGASRSPPAFVSGGQRWGRVSSSSVLGLSQSVLTTPGCVVLRDPLGSDPSFAPGRWRGTT